jgi:hypothetical protein
MWEVRLCCVIPVCSKQQVKCVSECVMCVCVCVCVCCVCYCAQIEEQQRLTRVAGHGNGHDKYLFCAVWVRSIVARIRSVGVG